MKLYFKVPPEADGALLRSFLRRCSVSADLSRAVKFRGSGFFADGVPILANRRVEAGQVISFELPPEGEGVAPQSGIPVNVVYEDAFALVLEKPPRLAVHPTLNLSLIHICSSAAAAARMTAAKTRFSSSFLCRFIEDHPLRGICSSSASQRAAAASLGIRQSPRGERVTLPTLGPSGRQLRLNCWAKNRQ